jgi:hypothetical protein
MHLITYYYKDRDITICKTWNDVIPVLNAKRLCKKYKCTDGGKNEYEEFQLSNIWRQSIFNYNKHINIIMVFDIVRDNEGNFINKLY